MALSGELFPTNYVPFNQHKQLLCEWEQSAPVDTIARSTCRRYFALQHLSVSLQDEEVILQNPADVLIYVQVLPLALLLNPSVFSGKLADR